MIYWQDMFIIGVFLFCVGMGGLLILELYNVFLKHLSLISQIFIILFIIGISLVMCSVFLIKWQEQLLEE